MTRIVAPFVAALLCISGICFSAEPQVKPEDLPRIKPTEPAEVMKTFQVRPGFHLELVAAEPLVMDPIAMCFDENGRLFVVEMRDYSERREERLGRIRMLEDTDGDGKFDKSTIYLENLPWPTAVFYYNGGVIVGACPDILYAKDTDGDGKADQIEKIFTGFGPTTQKLNVQGLFNNFIWGMDNRIHGCSGTVGGMVTRAIADGSPAALPRVQEPVDVRSKGLVIDPRNWTMTTENGGGQYGLSFDPTGRLFTCTNSSHIETFTYDARYASRNPYYTLPEPRISIAADGPAAEVFRISPEEPWRVIRTRWRIGGLVSGPIEGGGRSAGYFTSATGITIYKGDAFGPEYVGDAFIGDVGSNLIHHKRIRRDGLDLIAERPADEKKIEFVASTDNWFRPCDFANAPDGSLYVADMYRETIEHPWSLPPGIKKYLDLNSGNDRGRIYRIAPEGFKPRAAPKLGEATTAELVALLEHPNGWHRETASRLLFERQDRSAVALLVKMLEESKSGVARMHALHALEGMDGLSEAVVLKALADADAVVREHAVALSETLVREGKVTEALWAKLASLAEDPEITVRYQLAFTLGGIPHPNRNEVLISILRRDVENPRMRAAVLNSLTEGAGAVMVHLMSDPKYAVVLNDLAGMVGARGAEDEVYLVATRLANTPDDATAFGAASALAAGLARGGNPLGEVRNSLNGLLDRAAKAASNEDTPVKVRISAAHLIAYEEPDRAVPLLGALLAEKKRSGIQQAALAALDPLGTESAAKAILQHWSQLSPRARQEAVAMFSRRSKWGMQLLSAIETKSVPLADVDAAQAEALRKSPDAAVAQRARRLLPAPTTQRTAVVESFRPALSLKGDAKKGRIIYQQRCASCHRAGAEGFAVGPDLVTVKNSGAEKLLTSILDPSREVPGNSVAYLIETKDAQSVLGLISSDTTTTITIRQAYGRETVIPRARIKRMSSPGKSLMPDGLETGLSQQDVADLLQFIAAAEPIATK